MAITINPNGTLNLGTNGKIQATNIDLSGDWSNAPSGTVITVAYGLLNSTFSTTSDSQVATGLITSPLVKKLANGSAAGTSRIHVYCFGGNRDNNSTSHQDVTLFYRKINNGSYTERDYGDAQHQGGYWGPHCASLVDTSVGAMGVGDTVRYQMYVRSRGGSHAIYFHNEIGGVSGSPYIIAQEIVN
tara:strand:+ start:116 stop:676 length:561 start_codon:yes stop_codon:yes gene_type:complete